MNITLDIPSNGIYRLIHNTERYYLGNLVSYYTKLKKFATNLSLPYHNLRHTEHVLWVCFILSKYYDTLTKRELRILFIAAIFHDFNHLGGNKVSDHENIKRALAGLAEFIEKDDLEYFTEIYDLLKHTQIPHLEDSKELPLLVQILREADLSQCLASDWFLQVILGFSKEWKIRPIEILNGQEEFLHKELLKKNTNTKGAKIIFPPLIKERTKETRFLLSTIRVNAINHS